MKILVIEDSDCRIQVFKARWPDCVVVKNYRAAIRNLKSQVFDVVWFDHDLGGNKTGYDVALWMMDNAKFPVKAYVHSWNAAGAQRIKAVLDEAGVECVVEPFSVELIWRTNKT